MSTPTEHDPDQQRSDVPQQQQQTVSAPSDGSTSRKRGSDRLRRACVACHTGKTRCSEVLPCQSCLKRGLGSTCAYPEADGSEQHTPAPSINSTAFPPGMYGPIIHTAPNLATQQFYDYNGTFTGASTSTFRPSKRPRNLTEEEAAAITRNFSRGDFYVGNSGPVRIDPRLPVRLTLGEGDLVHFTVGEPLV